jgi:hypothetical protein
MTNVPHQLEAVRFQMFLQLLIGPFNRHNLDSVRRKWEVLHDIGLGPFNVE